MQQNSLVCCTSHNVRLTIVYYNPCFFPSSLVDCKIFRTVDILLILLSLAHRTMLEHKFSINMCKTTCIHVEIRLERYATKWQLDLPLSCFRLGSSCFLYHDLQDLWGNSFQSQTSFDQVSTNELFSCKDLLISHSYLYHPD